MANCQNNMRYGRQMNFNGTYRTMPGNDRTCQRSVPELCGAKSGDCRTPDRCGAKANDSRTPDRCDPKSSDSRTSDCRETKSSPRSTPECGDPRPCGGSMPERLEPKHTPGCSTPKPDRCPHDELQGLPIAMAYVPWQRWQNLYDHYKALQRGTIFEDLTKLFHGKGGCNR